MKIIFEIVVNDNVVWMTNKRDYMSCCCYLTDVGVVSIMAGAIL